jgi:DNA-binding transcriptional LysR family regulator
MQNRMELSAADLALVGQLIKFKSLSAAAKQLGLEQSTLSRQLSGLETRLGEPLFSRHRQGLEPTPGALRLEPYIQEIQELLLRAQKDFSLGNVSSEVHVSCSSPLSERILVPSLPTLLQKNPGLVVRLTSSSELSDLERLECDVAVRLGQKPPGNVVSQRVLHSPMQYFAHKTLVQRVGRTEWMHFPLVEFSHPKARIKHEQNVIFRSNCMNSCLSAVESAIGAMVLPVFFGKKLESLVELVGPPELPYLDVYLSSPVVVRRSPAVDATWRWLFSLFQD